MKTTKTLLVLGAILIVTAVCLDGGIIPALAVAGMLLMALGAINGMYKD